MVIFTKIYLRDVDLYANHYKQLQYALANKQDNLEIYNDTIKIFDMNYDQIKKKNSVYIRLQKEHYTGAKIKKWAWSKLKD